MVTAERCHFWCVAPAEEPSRRGNPVSIHDMTKWCDHKQSLFALAWPHTITEPFPHARCDRKVFFPSNFWQETVQYSSQACPAPGEGGPCMCFAKQALIEEHSISLARYTDESTGTAQCTKAPCCLFDLDPIFTTSACPRDEMLLIW